MDSNFNDIVYNKFREFFYQKTGHDLLKYNEKFLKIKIKQRLKEIGISSFREYFEKMIVNSRIDTEIEILFNIIINKESDFFRYPEHFEFLTNFIIPEIIKDNFKNKNSIFKLLSIGIAFGQEPFSIAMMLEENKVKLQNFNLKIDAVDIVKRNINYAEKGIYDNDILRYFTRYKESKFQDLFRKYFIPFKENTDYYKIDDDLKKYIQFKKMDIIKDNINDVYDVVFYRNVMIYFNDKHKEETIKKIYNSLKNGGYLFLGHSEFPVGFREKFKTIFWGGCMLYQKTS